MYSASRGDGERRNWNERQGEMKRKRRKSPGREDSPREKNWIRQRERKRAVQRVFDKWAVYLAFTVNEAGCDDVFLPSLCLCIPHYEVRLLGLSVLRVEETQLPVHCQRVGHLAES